VNGSTRIVGRQFVAVGQDEGAATAVHPPDLGVVMAEYRRRRVQLQHEHAQLASRAAAAQTAAAAVCAAAAAKLSVSAAARARRVEARQQGDPGPEMFSRR
jgi:hypothetical protein